MKNRISSPSVVMVATLALFVGAAVAQTQDRGTQPSDQQTSSHRLDQQTRQQRDRNVAQSRPDTSTRAGNPTSSQTATRNVDRNSVQIEHSRTETARSHEARPGEHQVASADRGTDVDRYRREHPHAAARCHDGFFTTTTDRRLACSKHGGIEIWLLQ